MSLKLATSSNTATTIGLTPTTSLMARVPFAINSGNNVPCYLEDGVIKFNKGLTYTTATGVTMTKDFDTINDTAGASTANVTANVAKVGSPSISSTGIASGFASTSYLMIPRKLLLEDVQYWEMVAGFTLTGTSSASSCIYSENNASYHSGLLVTTGNKLYTQLSNTHSSFIGSETGTTTLQTNTKYYVKMIFSGSKYQVFLSTTGEFAGEETTEITISSTEKLLDFDWNIGCTALSGYQQPFDNGTIDLRDCYIKLNSSLFWSGTTGSYKIVLPSTGNQPYLFGGNVIVDDEFPINANIVGIPTVSNGVVSGFNDYDYVTLSKSFASAVGSNPWETCFKFTTGTNLTYYQGIFSGSAGTFLPDLPAISAGSNFLLALSSNGSSYDIASTAGTYTVLPNTTYWVKCTYTGSQYTLSYSLDGTNFTTDITVTSSTHIENTTDISSFGVRLYLKNAFQGSIDLKESYIKINNQMWWNGAGNTGDVWVNPQTPIIVQKFNGTAWESFTGTILMDSDVSVSGSTISNLVAPTYNTNNVVNNSTKTSFLGMPSGRYISLILGATGTQYVAPANGWVLLSKGGSNGQWCYITNMSRGYRVSMLPNGSVPTGLLPVFKGDVFVINYNTTVTEENFRFIYAEGEV